MTIKFGPVLPGFERGDDQPGRLWVDLDKARPAPPDPASGVDPTPLVESWPCEVRVAPVEFQILAGPDPTPEAVQRAALQGAEQLLRMLADDLAYLCRRLDEENT